jgi:hypothetical protein
MRLAIYIARGSVAGNLLEVKRSSILLWQENWCRRLPVQLWGRSGQCLWRGMDDCESQLVPYGVQLPEGRRP